MITTSLAGPSPGGSGVWRKGDDNLYYKFDDAADEVFGGEGVDTFYRFWNPVETKFIVTKSYPNLTLLDALAFGIPSNFTKMHDHTERHYLTKVTYDEVDIVGDFDELYDVIHEVGWGKDFEFESPYTGSGGGPATQIPRARGSGVSQKADPVSDFSLGLKSTRGDRLRDLGGPGGCEEIPRCSATLPMRSTTMCGVRMAEARQRAGLRMPRCQDALIINRFQNEL